MELGAIMHSHHLWKLIAWSLVAILAICLCLVSALFFEASFKVLRRRTEGKTDPSSVRTRATFEKMKKKGYSGITLGLMFCASGLAYLAILVFIKAIISSQHSQILGFLLTYSLPLIFSMVLIALFLITMKSLGRTRIEKIRDMWDKREEETWNQGDETGPFASFLLWILSKFSAVTLFPITIPRELFYAVFPALHRIIPNPVILWLSILTYFAYRLEIGGSRTLALYLAISICASALYKSLFSLTTEQGVLSFFTQRKERISPGRILSYALILAVGFGCIHLHIWNTDNSNYAISNTPPFTWQDALYFSITTISTVGYGDIHPVKHVAQWACMTEIVCGLMLLVIAVNTSITLWLDKNRLRQEIAPEPLIAVPDTPTPAPSDATTESSVEAVKSD